MAEGRKSGKCSSAERRENEYSVTVRAMGQVHRLQRKEKIGRYEKDGLYRVYESEGEKAEILDKRQKATDQIKDER